MSESEQESDESPEGKSLEGESVADGEVIESPETAETIEIGESTSSEADEDIRVGSPFAVDPEPLPAHVLRNRVHQAQDFYDVGPLKYTALGAVGAAIVVLFFGGIAAWQFPVGGTFIAGLGIFLSLFGLYSHRRFPAFACLALHMVLFVACYGLAVQ